MKGKKKHNKTETARRKEFRTRKLVGNLYLQQHNITDRQKERQKQIIIR